MYNRSFGGSRNRGFSNNRRGYFPARRKSLDPRLFVKKAEYQEEEVYIPKHAFSDFAIDERLKANIAARGYKEPTKIQDEAIPYLLEGRDVVGIANTGTGKTAAFLIPLIDKILRDPRERVLIITPTRELAVQIEQELMQFARGLNIYSVLCIGGVKIYPQINRLRRDPHFVIGTPGRLKDLNQQRVLDLRFYNNIVLDEVDRMLDMGFIEDVKYLISGLPSPRHSLFFSATMPDKVRMIMREFLYDPITVSVKVGETAVNVDQDIIRINGGNKVDTLHELLAKKEFNKVLVFLRAKFGTERLARALEQRGFRVEAIHGNKTQSQRQRAIDAFKRDRVNILLATDVASRGLDIDDVTHVINYDAPESYEDYVHRIGRTARAGKRGTALTFVE